MLWVKYFVCYKYSQSLNKQEKLRNMGSKINSKQWKQSTIQTVKRLVVRSKIHLFSPYRWVEYVETQNETICRHRDYGDRTDDERLCWGATERRKRDGTLFPAEAIVRQFHHFKLRSVIESRCVEWSVQRSE